MPINYAKMKNFQPEIVYCLKKYSDDNIFDNLKFRGTATTLLFETHQAPGNAPGEAGLGSRNTSVHEPIHQTSESPQIVLEGIH